MTVLTIFMLTQMPGPRDIVIYWPDPRAFSVVQKPWGWAHILVQKPRGARGMVTGQIDTCINCSNSIIEMHPGVVLRREKVPRGLETVSRKVKADWTDFSNNLAHANPRHQFHGAIMTLLGLWYLNVSFLGCCQVTL